MNIKAMDDERWNDAECMMLIEATARPVSSHKKELRKLMLNRGMIFT